MRAALFALLLPAATAAFAATRPASYRAAPPPGHTGGFGEPSCHTCHFDNDLNEGWNTEESALVLDGVAGSYAPGRTYRITVRLRHPELRRGGFQLAARYASGEAQAREAGSLRALDDRVAVTHFGSPAVGYAHHTDAGSDVATEGTARWVLEWTAPADALAPVVFHIAANAANDDDSELGDKIFVRDVVLPPLGAKN
jgi:hypothetical protein